MLRVVILKPSKYGIDGHVERFRRGFMPNATVPYIRSLTPDRIGDCQLQTVAIDEYVQTRLDYLGLLKKSDVPTLLALVGVQSHQFQRALDLAAFARANGVEHCVIGGPHPMTCDTWLLQGRGISFAMAEAELIWPQILGDAVRGELAPAYGEQQRWQQELQAPALIPPARSELRKYVVPMLGIYPARGCPFNCSFCSVIKIAGRQIRSQSIDTTLKSLRAAKAAGIEMAMFTSDNFNKYSEAADLLTAMIEEKLRIPFFVQCDTQISRQEDLIDLLARAGCYQMFVGVESFSRNVLIAARKTQNRPERYGEIVRLCGKYGITSHFSNIIGFPEDTADDVTKHLDALRSMQPDVASFYILTPIPGTQQYGEFMAKGWITERNLDRFDGTVPTWRHPALSGNRLTALLFHCYRKFYDAGHIVRAGWQSVSPRYPFVGARMGIGLQMFMRFSAAMGWHPMSGGIGHVTLDSAADYRELRTRRFGFDLLPLPHNLALSAADETLNQAVKLAG